MSLPRIVGVTGYAQHGKDTVAGVLVREFGYERVALADMLKNAMLTLDPYVNASVRLTDLFQIGGWEHAKKLPEVRRLLQVFGTEVGRMLLGEDVWIEALVRHVRGFYDNNGPRVVIPDIRFVNEAHWIRRVGELWRVDRPGFDNGVGTQHASERDIGSLHVDHTFINGGTKSSFEERIRRYANHREAQVTKMFTTDDDEGYGPERARS